MSNLISISDARTNLPDLVNKVSNNMDRIIITVNGKPKATLLSAEELESLEETAEVLAIPNIKKDISESRKQIKSGEFVSLSDLK
ncbi:MAG: prevent-host-death family protein [Candidatus Levybacteria bacterium CG_4_9_14_3_um_filter_35_16]|nr:MAG: prevent-host-death family protein [Candidatus Levybacteria bacterium CG22_combo_CG10-13_8_21_14_all_35_11]PIY94074.1 MAG: prevent-host-death family protein [Candidatus Levybacteria bacterium CG_4_10_14_0_8_um_filter_35_23]PJA00881.1 MAG: prevent-host-death family protein [Candidatus Levybacteria bacterium CG_4_10_14_0_2_um_filter_35_8]PJA91250.1 MAG: prevent-host-death family protein [Candidatus Levybacteria bacterium CG_4_9_14_3_um_filter_35_16]PJC54307.1 MAG: prevent-host-death family